MKSCQIIASSPRNLFCFNKTELLAVSWTFSELLQLGAPFDRLLHPRMPSPCPSKSYLSSLLYLKFCFPYKQLSWAFFLSGPRSTFCVFDTTYLLFFTIYWTIHTIHIPPICVSAKVLLLLGEPMQGSPIHLAVGSPQSPTVHRSPSVFPWTSGFWGNFEEYRAIIW